MNSLGSRRICLDYHFADFGKDILKDANPKKMVKMLKDSNVDCLMMFLKDHWGNVYYESDFPQSLAPRIENINYDLFGAVLKEAKKQGLKIIGYSTICWEENFARSHPDCLSVNKDGVPLKAGVKGMWSLVCINSPYRDFTFAQSREMVEKYDFPVFFVDIIQYIPGRQFPCYCRYCQKLWAAEYGSEIPKELTVEDKAMYIRFRDKFVDSYLKELSATIKSARPGIQFTHNFGIINDHDDYLVKEGEPWGHDYFSGSMHSKVVRAIANGREFTIFTARFNQLWDFTVKPTEQLIWEMATIFSHQGNMSIIDQADFKGGLFPQSYKAIKEVYSQAPGIKRELEGFRPYADIALVYSYPNQELNLDAFDFAELEPRFAAAYKLLTELHLPFDVVTTYNFEPERLKKYKLLILPGIKYIKTVHVNCIKEYVRNGGNVLYTYQTAIRDEDGKVLPKDLKSFGIVDICMESPYTTKFIQTSFDMGNPYLRINGSLAYVEPIDPDNTEVLARVTVPVTEITDKRWISHDIHPGSTTEHPAILITKHGKGHFTYFPFNFFLECAEQDLPSFVNTFNTVLSNVYSPGIILKAPRVVESNYYVDSKNKLKVALTNCTTGKPFKKLVKKFGDAAVNYHNNMLEVIPIADIKIETGRTVKSCTSLQGAKLLVERKGKLSSVTLSKLGIYDVITILFD